MMVFEESRGRKKKHGAGEIKKQKKSNVLHTQAILLIKTEIVNSEDHVNNFVRKGTIPTRQVQGLVKRLFRVRFRKRMWLYNRQVTSLMSYGAEVLGWKEWVEVEKVQTKYIKCCLEMDRWTPNYIIRKEILRNRIHSNTIKRAARFEEKSETEDKKPLLNKCVEEVTKCQTETEWGRQRMKSINECSLNQEVQKCYKGEE